MDLATLISDAQLAVSVAKLAIAAGQDAAPYIENAYLILFQGKVLTTEERAGMAAQEVAWRNDVDSAIAKDDSEV